MTTRRERRQKGPAREADLATRLRGFFYGWGGIISGSILLIIVVLVIGIFRVQLPGINQPPAAPPDDWGTVSVASGGTVRIAYIGNSTGAGVDASGAPAAIRQVLKDRPKIKDATIDLKVVEDSCSSDAATTLNAAKEIGRAHV